MEMDKKFSEEFKKYPCLLRTLRNVRNKGLVSDIEPRKYVLIK